MPTPTTTTIEQELERALGILKEVGWSVYPYRFFPFERWRKIAVFLIGSNFGSQAISQLGG